MTYFEQLSTKEVLFLLKCVGFNKLKESTYLKNKDGIFALLALDGRLTQFDTLLAFYIKERAIFQHSNDQLYCDFIHKQVLSFKDYLNDVWVENQVLIDEVLNSHDIDSYNQIQLKVKGDKFYTRQEESKHYLSLDYKNASISFLLWVLNQVAATGKSTFSSDFYFSLSNPLRLIRYLGGASQLYNHTKYPYAIMTTGDSLKQLDKVLKWRVYSWFTPKNMQFLDEVGVTFETVIRDEIIFSLPKGFNLFSEREFPMDNDGILQQKMAIFYKQKLPRIEGSVLTYAYPTNKIVLKGVPISSYLDALEVIK